LVIYKWQCWYWTITPGVKLDVFNSSPGNVNQIIVNLIRESTPTGGSNILRLGYHSTSDIELNSGYSSNGFRYGSYFDLNIVNNNTGGQYGGINFVTNSLNRLIITANGNVGIGTTTPSAKLQVYTSGAGNAQTWGNNNTVNTSIYDYNTSPNSPSIVFGDGTGWKFHIAKKSDNGATKFLTIQDNNGNVGIGITNPQYKLAVEGTIAAREVKVTAETWADFVFHPTYKLCTLGEVEQFIKANNHLPEIPTEAEVKENGIGLGEMNAKLLQKIEELTLYMIEQQKRILELEQQNQRITEIERKMKAILSKD